MNDWYIPYRHVTSGTRKHPPHPDPTPAASAQPSAAVQAHPGAQYPKAGTCHGQTAETEPATVAKLAYTEAIAPSRDPKLSQAARHAADPSARTTRVHERDAETCPDAGTGPTTTQRKLHGTLLILLCLVLLLGVGGMLLLLLLLLLLLHRRRLDQ